MRKGGGTDNERGLLSKLFPAFVTVKGTPAKNEKIWFECFPIFCLEAIGLQYMYSYRMNFSKTFILRFRQADIRPTILSPL